MKKILLLLTIATLAVSCAETELGTYVEAVQREVALSVAMPTNSSATRIAISEDTESGDWITSWNDGDCLGGWSIGAEKFSKFEMEGSTDGKSANFSGTINGDKLRLFYPYDADWESTTTYYNIDLARQNVAVGSFDHMKDYTYMVSENYTINDATSITMKHIGAAMELSLRFENIPADTEAQIKQISMSGNNIYNNIDARMLYDVETEGFYNNTTTSAYSLNVAENSIANFDGTDATTYSIPFNIFPFTIEPKAAINFDIYVEYKTNDTKYLVHQSITAPNTTTKAIEFARSTHSNINKIVDMRGAITIAYSLADFSADSYPTNNDTWIITDSSATTEDFAGLSAAIAALNDSGRKISLRFPNIDAIPNFAIFGEENKDNSYPSDALVSVSADVAKSVGNAAFDNCDALTSVEFPAATEIGSSAFDNCDVLTSVELPAATEIGSSAFDNCNALTSVEIPSATVIGGFTFYYCEALTAVEIPSATVIGSYAFYNCEALTAVEIPSATVIGSYALSNCDSITSLDIPSSVTEIGSGAFSGCDNLTTLNLNTPHFILEDGIVYNSNKSTIISALKAVASGAYYSTSVTHVENYAFYDCDALTSVEFPEATVIEGDAFSNCDALTSIVFPKAKELHEWNTFSNCDALTSVEIPAATSIGGTAFNSCDVLTSVEFPAATSIDGYAFSACNALTSVKIPAATKIDKYAFSWSNALAYIELATASNSMLSTIDIDAFAFSTTTNITLAIGIDNRKYVNGNTLTVGDFSADFKKIIFVNENGEEIVPEPEKEKPSYAFYLSELSANNYPTDTDTWTIWDDIATTEDFAGLSAAIAALNDSERKISLEFPNIDTIPNFAIFGKNEENREYPSAALHSVSAEVATSIGSYAFFNCDALTSVELPVMTEIDEYAFYNCDALTSVELPMVTEIKGSVFWGCNALTSIELPMAISIGDRAFVDCYALTSIELPTATEIDEYAFCNCVALKSVEIPAVTSIGGTAFYNCVALTSVELPVATSIGDSAFNNCDALTSVELPVAASIGDSAFNNCDALTSIEIPSTVTSIGAGAFSSCNKLTTLDLNTSHYIYEDGILFTNDKNTIISALSAIVSGDIYYSTVTTLSQSAIEECDALTSVKLPAANVIENYAFFNCDALTSVELPVAIWIGWFTLKDCDKLTSVKLPAATSINGYVFSDCDTLTSVELATNDNTVLSSIAITAFENITTTNITLTLGSANSQFVSGNTLTVGDFSAEFKEIILE